MFSRFQNFTAGETEIDLGQDCNTVIIENLTPGDIFPSYTEQKPTSSLAKIAPQKSLSIEKMDKPINTLRILLSAPGNLNIIAYNMLAWLIALLFAVQPSVAAGYYGGGTNAQGAQGGTLPAAGASGNVLTSDGTNWASAAAAAGGLTPLNGFTYQVDKVSGQYYIGTNGATTFTALGFPALTITSTSGTVAAGQVNDSHIIKYTTGTTATNNCNGIQASTWRHRGYGPALLIRARAASSTDVRYWLGWTNGSSWTGTATPGTSALSGAAFRFDTSVGDATWKAVTFNGATQTVADTGIALDTANLVNFVIKLGDGGAGSNDAKFYINNVLVQTISATLPGNGTNIQAGFAVTNLNVSANVLDVMKIAGEAN